MHAIVRPGFRHGSPTERGRRNDHTASVTEQQIVRATFPTRDATEEFHVAEAITFRQHLRPRTHLDQCRGRRHRSHRKSDVANTNIPSEQPSSTTSHNRRERSCRTNDLPTAIVHLRQRTNRQEHLPERTTKLTWCEDLIWMFKPACAEHSRSTFCSRALKRRSMHHPRRSARYHRRDESAIISTAALDGDPAIQSLRIFPNGVELDFIS